MDDVVSMPRLSHDRPLLRRRSSSVVVLTTKLNLLPDQSSSATTSSSSDDLELLSIRPSSHSYTSLKDLIPSAAVNSPKPISAPTSQLGSDIGIRNRLVKQAAWAYLQPMSSSPGSAGGTFFHRLWPRVAAVFDFVHHSVVRVLDWMLRIFRVRGSG